jgi:hypothetical protein
MTKEDTTAWSWRYMSNFQLITGDPSAATHVLLTYLTSYERMGRAEVTCMEGCR